MDPITLVTRVKRGKAIRESSRDGREAILGPHRIRVRGNLNLIRERRLMIGQNEPERLIYQERDQTHCRGDEPRPK